MAGASTDVLEFDSMARGQHVYKTVWTPLIDEALQMCGTLVQEEIPMNMMNML